jgi:hypothetical protein
MGDGVSDQLKTDDDEHRAPHEVRPLVGIDIVEYSLAEQQEKGAVKRQESEQYRCRRREVARPEQVFNGHALRQPREDQAVNEE